MIKSFKKFIGESFVDDIIRRGITGEDRTEDSVDLLDRNGLYKYLKNRYAEIDNFHISNDHLNYISVPIIVSKPGRICYVLSIIYNKQDKLEFIDISSKCFDEHQDIKNKISEIAKIVNGEKYNYFDTSYSIHIFQKDGKISNTFFIKIIDNILDNTDKPALKIKNEERA